MMIPPGYLEVLRQKKAQKDRKNLVPLYWTILAGTLTKLAEEDKLDPYCWSGKRN